MSLPVMVVLEEDDDAVARIEAELNQRYGRDYRVESRSDAEGALQLLTELADAGSDVALVLAGRSLVTASDGALLDRSRRLLPHAKRALLVPAVDAWMDQPTAEAIRSALALGRIDHYARADEIAG